MTSAATLLQPAIFPTREGLGAAAAKDVAGAIRSRLLRQAFVRIIFAAAPSQSEMLHELALAEGIDWSRVEAFHMDEYIGLPVHAPQRFGNWLKREFFDKVPLGAITLIEPASDPEASASLYAVQLAQKPVDMVCLGIGSNGHLAFNDPPALFEDASDVKVVELEWASRQQQVDDGLFTTIEQVPTHAVTLTIPRLLRSDLLFCCVPGRLKQDAVRRAFTGTVHPESPASILRTHTGCKVYLDAESAAGLK